MPLQWQRLLNRQATKHIFQHARQFDGSFRHYASSTPHDAIIPTAKTRNIGIIAHIDAGKTTTTERMLYYSGFTRRLGDVDEGSTVTDFLPAERARGITIQSAAISFLWPPTGDISSPAPVVSPRSASTHNINLIDTPGHADFTFEVLRSLRVLDGAVCILDGVAGVEAQTEKVWSQASTYTIPRIIFVNKLDRDGAAFGRTVREIGAKLNVWPAVCSIPWWTDDGRLQGIGDVVGLKALRYPEGGDGKDIDVFDMGGLASVDKEFIDQIRKARVALVELLSEHDDHMVELYLNADEDHLAIASNEITDSLRRCVLREDQQMLVPAYAGASFRNVGVQPLLDAVVDLLPSPNERPSSSVSLSSDVKGSLQDLLAGKLLAGAAGELKAVAKSSKKVSTVALQKLEACALAFKVVADPKRGVLVYVRVYSGTIAKGASLWNTNLQSMERPTRLLKMYANDAVDIDTIPAGQIGVIPGLKFARTGDTLVSYTGANPKTGPPQPVNNLQLRPIVVPPPVFFVSVEPNSLAEEKHIKECLDILRREDPSLHISIDEESGQTHLAGMGELHLEIARDRLVKDFKAKARIGSIEIGYREAITAAIDDVTETFNSDLGGKFSRASCTAAILPASLPIPDTASATHTILLPDDNTLLVTTSTLDSSGTPTTSDHPSLPPHLPLPIVLQSLQNGVSAALARGPTHSYALHSTIVHLTFDPATHLNPDSTPAALSSAARLAVSKALRLSARESATVLMEPVMMVTIGVDEESLGAVVHDISSARGGSVIELGGGEEGTAEEGRVDVSRVYAPADPFAGGHVDGGMGSAGSNGAVERRIVARVPLREMVGYLKHLRSLTGGRGTFTMAVDRFERMSAQRQKIVLNEMRGDVE